MKRNSHRNSKLWRDGYAIGRREEREAHEDAMREVKAELAKAQAENKALKEAAKRVA